MKLVLSDNSGKVLSSYIWNSRYKLYLFPQKKKNGQFVNTQVKRKEIPFIKRIGHLLGVVVRKKQPHTIIADSKFKKGIR